MDERKKPDIPTRAEAAHIIEAILFVAGEAVRIEDVAAALGLTELEAVQTVEEMQRQYDLERRGVTLRYATTDRLLEHFGRSDIRERPPLPQGAVPLDPGLPAEGGQWA